MKIFMLVIMFNSNDRQSSMDKAKTSYANANWKCPIPSHLHPSKVCGKLAKTFTNAFYSNEHPMAIIICWVELSKMHKTPLHPSATSNRNVFTNNSLYVCLSEVNCIPYYPMIVSDISNTHLYNRNPTDFRRSLRFWRNPGVNYVFIGRISSEDDYEPRYTISNNIWDTFKQQSRTLSLWAAFPVPLPWTNRLDGLGIAGILERYSLLPSLVNPAAIQQTVKPHVTWYKCIKPNNKSSQWLPNTPFASISECLVS